MAVRNKNTVQGSLNLWTGGEWDVQTALDIGSQAHAYKTLDTKTGVIVIYSESACYMRFDQLTTDTISTSNDIIIPAETLFTFNVPLGLRDKYDSTSITVHFKQVTSVSGKSLRLVEV